MRAASSELDWLAETAVATAGEPLGPNQRVTGSPPGCPKPWIDASTILTRRDLDVENIDVAERGDALRNRVSDC